MKFQRFALIIPLLSWAACTGSGGTTSVSNNGTNQILLVTYLAADDVAGGAAGTGVASTGEAGTTGASGTTGAAGATTPTPTPTPSPSPYPYQVISTGSTTTDPNLVNAWGLAFSPNGPIWVAAAGTGLGVVYDSSGVIQPIVVTVPPALNQAPPSAPTGLVFNPTAGFLGDKFIFATEGGTIAGWQSGTEAVTRADNSDGGSIYKGLTTMTTASGVSRIYATDFHNRRVDMWDDAYVQIATTGFVDVSIPSNYSPFGIQAINGAIYVTYAKMDDAGEDDDPGQGHGFVDVYDFDGVLLTRLITEGALNSPWGVAMAPSDFGALSGALLVGNFGDGRINAFDPATGVLIGTALDAAGNALRIDGLWALAFGNETVGAAHNQLFFTAGPNDEEHGAFGRLDLP